MSRAETQKGTFEIDGVTFEAVENRHMLSTPDHFGVCKSVWMIDRYRELAREFPAADIVEIGIDQGASTAMLALLFAPRRLSAFDIADVPVEALDSFIRHRELGEVVCTHWGVDQADTDALLALVSDDFSDRSLDIVIDDASHLLGPTTSSFEALFPRLRPGGIFVIEDWSFEHRIDRSMGDKLVRDDEEAEHLRAELSARINQAGAPPMPLSNLILQLVIAAAHSPDIIADVRVRLGWCEVRRGPGSLDASFTVRHHIGNLGRHITRERSSSDSPVDAAALLEGS